MVDDGLEFLVKLEDALRQRHDYLEAHEIQRLKDSFHNYQTELKSVLNLLTRKSLIKEDPYKHEQKISEVTVPSTDPVLESEKVEQISMRLSNFESQLDFFNNFYQVTVDFLDLSRVRLLSKLVKYVDWEKLSDASGNVNTRTVAELFGKVRLGSDKLSISVLNDAQNQLAKATEDILSVLRNLTSYHRERYKHVLRKHLFANINLDAATVSSQRDEVLRRLKVRFAQLAAKSRSRGGDDDLPRGTPYYPELVAEILDEDYSEYGQNLRDGILEKLQVQEVRPAAQGEPDFRPLLIEALRLIGTAGMPMEAAIQKLLDNAQALEQRKLGIGARIRLWLMRLVGTEAPKRTYEIEMPDPETAITRVERLDFTTYAERVVKRCKVLESISNKMSSTYAKLAQADDQQVQNFLSANLNEVHTLYRKMPALDDYFRTRLAKQDRSRFKGIRMETNAIKNAVVKSNQKMHEYLSRVEEGTQLKRLGITDVPSP